MADPQKADRGRFYNQHKRNPDSVKFYNSAAWKRCRADYIRQHPICERCQSVTADHVHHRIPLASCTDAQRIDHSNLQSLCISCHNAVEAETVAPARRTSIGTITPVEDAEYYYDAEAADRPIRFIEKYFQHYEGRFAGEPFHLLDWQKDQIIRPLFGWKNRTTGLRRFRELYLLTGKGAGKTPLVSMIGMFLALADNEAAPHVVSMASSFEQAGLTFNAAKLYIETSPLRKHPQIQCKQHVIELPKHGKWTVVSGKNKGRSGTRPSCVIADEIHEFDGTAAENFRIVTANLFKRSQPLLIIATNAGKDQSGFAWEQHERAVAVLDGTADDPTLLPVIYEADRSHDWRSEEAAKAANPSIPSIVSFDQIKPEQSKGEARYRRLYLSQWGTTAPDKWIDQDQYRECVNPFTDADVADAPLYIGLDLSLGDDLCCACEVYPTATMYHVKARFWLPRATAEKYHAKHAIQYHVWSDQQAITLLDEPTISTAVCDRIADEIIQLHRHHPITAVCYDRAYSSGVIPALQAAGIECRPIGQSWGVSTGCHELARRLKEKSITIQPNPVLDFCAENVCVKTDKHDNLILQKPGATDQSTGNRAKKIDGIQALVTALTEARKHSFAKTIAHVGAMVLEL